LRTTTSRLRPPPKLLFTTATASTFPRLSATLVWTVHESFFGLVETCWPTRCQNPELVSGTSTSRFLFAAEPHPPWITAGLPSAP
jgi:hypothetical protein